MKKKFNTRMTLAAAVAASVLILAGCGGSDDPPPAAEENPGMDTGGGDTGGGDTGGGDTGGGDTGGGDTGGGDTGGGDTGGVNPSTIPLNPVYAAFTGTCSLGVSSPAAPDSTGVNWSYDNGVATFVDGAETVVMTYNGTPTGSDDQASNPTSATFSGPATSGGTGYNLTLSISADGFLIGAGYNPDPPSSTPTPAEELAVDQATVLCGSLALPTPRS